MSRAPAMTLDPSRKPLGYAASEEDWNEAFAGRPMSLRDWNELTLGEQARYAARECQTKGANYTSRICEDRIEFTVALPPSLRLSGLTKDEAERIERYLHRKIEAAIVPIIQLRTERARNADLGIIKAGRGVHPEKHRTKGGRDNV